jgi:peptidoglycan hydrolase CwlO-like protein
MPILTWSRKVALTAAGVITLLATGIGTIPNTQANTSSSTGSQAPSSAIAALQERRAQLIAELAAMEPSLSAAGGAVNSAERMFNAQQQKVLNERKQLAKLNATLLSLSSELNSNNATAAQDKAQLAAITRATYETSGSNQVLAAVLSAQSFNQAIDELKAANQVSQQVLNLVERLAASNHAILAEQTTIRGDAASAETLEGQLAAQSDKLITVLEDRNRGDREHRQPDRLSRGRPARWWFGFLWQPLRVRLLHVLRRDEAVCAVARQCQQLVDRGAADGVPGR